jgi:hypothetical protein
MEKLNEKIIVGAIFGHDNPVSPAWFVWNGRKIRVTHTNYSWTERQGTDMLHHFAVTDGQDSYELVLDTTSLAWRLAGVDTGG